MSGLSRLSSLARIAGFGTGPSVERLASIEQKLDVARTEVEAAQDKVSALEAEREEIVSALREEIQFEQILPDKKSAKLHQQLLENERVHPVDTVDELVEKRVGGEGANKRCFARVIANGKPTLTAGIFTALIKVPAEEGQLEYGQIPGNIEDVRELPVEEFVPPEEGSEEAVVAILYTISSSSKHEWERGGRPLAGAVYNFLHAEAQEKGYNLVISTLSPVRKFSNWLAEKEEYAGFFGEENENGQPVPTEEFHAFLESEENRDLIRAQLMEYLVSQKDQTLNFHLGNGAYIGDLKFNPENDVDWVMVNYVYPSNDKSLNINHALYKQHGIRSVAPHLEGIIGDNIELLSSVKPVVNSHGNAASVPTICPCAEGNAPASEA